MAQTNQMDHNKNFGTPATTTYFQAWGVISLGIRILGVLKVGKNLLGLKF